MAVARANMAPLTGESDFLNSPNEGRAEPLRAVVLLGGEALSANFPLPPQVVEALKEFKRPVVIDTGVPSLEEIDGMRGRLEVLGENSVSEYHH